MIDYKEMLKKYIFCVSTEKSGKDTFDFFSREEQKEMNKLQDDAVRQYYPSEEAEQEILELNNKRDKLFESFKNA